MDFDPAARLLVLGSYDTNLYVYLDSGSGFLPTGNDIVTDSQILATSLLGSGELYLGHMNGDISKHEWNSGTSQFTTQADFHSEPGSRVSEVQGCPDQTTVAPKEKMGWFHPLLLDSNGSQLDDRILDEFVIATMEFPLTAALCLSPATCSGKWKFSKEKTTPTPFTEPSPSTSPWAKSLLTLTLTSLQSTSTPNPPPQSTPLISAQRSAPLQMK